MTIRNEISIANFDFWAGAKYTAKTLTLEQLDIIDAMLEELCPDGMTETELNDFFWFDTDTIADWLGFEDWEALEEAANE
jgi:hypothetical protein